MEFKINNCLFCNIEADRIVHEYKHFYVIRDAFPVTPLHSLIITKRHVVRASIFNVLQRRTHEIPMILDTQKTELKILDNTITGFNINEYRCRCS